MFCFVGFGTDRLRREEAMKTADRENQKRGVKVPRNRAHGAASHDTSSSIKWAAKQEKFRPQEKCFFLTSPFIELIRTWETDSPISGPIPALGGTWLQILKKNPAKETSRSGISQKDHIRVSSRTPCNANFSSRNCLKNVPDGWLY
jgi:hypothetical protein